MEKCLNGGRWTSLHYFSFQKCNSCGLILPCFTYKSRNLGIIKDGIEIMKWGLYFWVFEQRYLNAYRLSLLEFTKINYISKTAVIKNCSVSVKTFIKLKPWFWQSGQYVLLFLLCIFYLVDHSNNNDFQKNITHVTYLFLVGSLE